MVDKMFHHLVSRVRHIAQEESADDVVHLMMRLFAVPPSPENAAQSSAASLDEAPIPSQPNPKLAE